MWVVGVVVVVIVAIALVTWLWVRANRPPPPPELTEPEAHPPEGRDPTWDPRRRYDDPGH